METCYVCIQLGELIYNYFDLYQDIPDTDSMDEDAQLNPVHLGTFKQLKDSARTCPTCAKLVRRMEELAETQHHETSDLATDDAICEALFPNDSVDVHITASHLASEIVLIPFQESTAGLQQGVHTFARPINGANIDIEQLRGWLKSCDEKHGGTCHSMNHEAQPHATPQRLIDVECQCLVSGTGVEEYVTLSYVWGQAKVTRTLTANLEDMMRPGILAEADTQVPATIRDAIKLTRLLGRRYLWVDSFCIIQDHANKQTELDRMGDYYRNASFTIIAAEGDHADHGLSGVPGGSRQRTFNYETFEFLPGKPVLRLPFNMSSYAGSAWDSRAWTFQEALFSRRVIVFSETVKWNCRKIAVVEPIDTPAEHSASFCIEDDNQWSYVLGLAPTPLLAEYPSESEYFLNVTSYNRRRLTYDDDVLDAVAGLTDDMSRYFQGGFTQGIPDLIFDIGLLWQPSEPLRRRIADVEGSRSQTPSWSWTGWQGVLDYHLWFDASDWLGNGLERKIAVYPVAMYYCGGKTGISRHIDNSFHTYRERFASNVDYPLDKIPESDLPRGWYRKLGRAERTDYIQYGHPALDESIFRSYNYPLPMMNDKPHLELLRNGPLLFFDTTTVTLRLGEYVSVPATEARKIRRLYTFGQACDTDLRTDDLRWAGIIRHNVSKADVPPEQPCKLIAISRGEIRQDSLGQSGLTEWDHPEREKDAESGYYRFYNVLWIEEVDGICYRKALGRVVQEIWDSHETKQPMSVVLG